MSRLDELLNKEKWLEYFEYKQNQSNLTKKEEDRLLEFIENEEYVTISKKIIDGTYTFSIPKKTLVNKSGVKKKRVVYSFPYVENTILKFILYLMADYDYIFSKNLFSFRKKHTVQRAFNFVLSHRGIRNMYAFKVDISNYFNSIDIGRLLGILSYVLRDDGRLLNLLKDILLVDKSIFEGKVIDEKRGAMAGTSISTFFANVYLMDVDKYFYDNHILYARYSDDIIIFGESKEKIEEYKKLLYDLFASKGLTINKDKEFLFEPGSAWNFLGLEYVNGQVDIADITFKKIKAKIRRKARSIRRWGIRKNVDYKKCIKVMTRVFNNKFYLEFNTKNLSWCKWFFPLITTSKKLKLIDEHLISYLRYIRSGKFSKKNYELTYDELKKLGFRSLVNEYYKFKKHKTTDENA